MAWRRPGNKPLAEPMMVSLVTHIYVTRPQWVKVMAWCPMAPSHYLNQYWLIIHKFSRKISAEMMFYSFFSLIRFHRKFQHFSKIILFSFYKNTFQTESLAGLAPSLLANIGVLCMTSEDVGWRMVITMWLERRPETHREILTQLCDKYLPPLMEYLQQLTASNILGQNSTVRHRRVIQQTDEAMVNTCTTLIEVSDQVWYTVVCSLIFFTILTIDTP